MNFTDGELRQRHAFVDESVAFAAEVYLDPAILKNSGELGLTLGALLDRVIVPNIVDGALRIPRRYKNSPEAIPMIALKPGEEVIIGDDFAAFTATQAAKATEVFETWQSHDDGQTIIDFLLDHTVGPDRSGAHQVVQIGNSAGMVVAMRLLFPLHYHELDFENAPPKKTIGSLLTRPLVALAMHAPDHLAEPDLMGHELMHVLQKTTSPVNAFGSQKDVDKTIMREELEAYHAGALIRLGMHDMGHPSEENATKVQVAVEAVRHQVNSGLHDPFLPTPELRRKLDSAFGIQNIVHQVIDFEAAQARLDQATDAA